MDRYDVLVNVKTSNSRGRDQWFCNIYAKDHDNAIEKIKRQLHDDWPRAVYSFTKIRKHGDVDAVCVDHVFDNTEPGNHEVLDLLIHCFDACIRDNIQLCVSKLGSSGRARVYGRVDSYSNDQQMIEIGDVDVVD